jgi:transposase
MISWSHGLIVPLGISFIKDRMPDVLEDARNELPDGFRALIGRLLEHFKLLSQQVEEVEQQIKTWHR